MEIEFYKYQGTGNDFILIDNRSLFFDTTNSEAINLMCKRKFGIGADGLILLENSDAYDFKMRYFNADGFEGSMCGNGGRCIVHFAHFLGIIDSKCTFIAADGIHHATINDDLVSLQMKEVSEIQNNKNHLFLNTGSPHHIEFTKDISQIDVYKQGKKIRYGSPYFDKGTNVNFVEQTDDASFKIRTYERGVENETLSCGTGATAVAIAVNKSNLTNKKHIFLETLGGKLEVTFDKKEAIYTNVFLKGKVAQVFKGFYSIE
ncbi:MAG TPA: diaminopimelate epimerase [Flavobacteriia bacterium]|nr:diaminopimelate epimerase [Flavobacteriia bacterium]